MYMGIQRQHLSITIARFIVIIFATSVSKTQGYSKPRNISCKKKSLTNAYGKLLISLYHYLYRVIFDL